MDFPLAPPVKRALGAQVILNTPVYHPFFALRLNIGTSPALVEAAVGRIGKALGRA